jgi:hypothetical protein
MFRIIAARVLAPSQNLIWCLIKNSETSKHIKFQVLFTYSYFAHIQKQDIIHGSYSTYNWPHHSRKQQNVL